MFFVTKSKKICSFWRPKKNSENILFFEFSLGQLVFLKEMKGILKSFS